jgi:metal-sulfur cluster biosynthetic enzyme
MLNKEIVLEALTKVEDPELNINIVKLGLIRDVEIGEYFEEVGVHEYIKVLMTLTSPMCPFADTLIQDVEDAVNLLGKGEAQVDLSFDPPWECPEDLKLELGLQ